MCSTDLKQGEPFSNAQHLITEWNSKMTALGQACALIIVILHQSKSSSTEHLKVNRIGH
jgi:hypothetical protein